MNLPNELFEEREHKIQEFEQYIESKLTVELRKLLQQRECSYSELSK
jgi:hypothetical protein